MKSYRLRYHTQPPFGNENCALYDMKRDIPDDGWEKWSLPIGNGYLGANVFGRTAIERLQITENSLYNPAVWDYADRCNAGLNSFCEIYLDFGHDFAEVSDYERSLSLNTAIAHTAYTLRGVRYEREYFASYPDRVLVVRLHADRSGALDFTLRPEVAHVRPYLLREGDGMGKSGSVAAEGNRITLTGEMEYYGIQFEGQITLLNQGGTLRTDAQSITVTGADSALLILAVGTNYRMESRVFLERDPKKKLAPYPHPHAAVTAITEAACSRSYAELRERHVKDYRALFDRAYIDLGGVPSELTTDALLKRYQDGERDPYLEELYFSYGRYLLIASSRPGTYPANLQGTWNQYASPPWTSGYWHNINVQMNYWPAFNTNLLELFLPYVAFFRAYLPQVQAYADAYVRTYFPQKYDAREGYNGITVGTGASLYRVDGVPPPGEGHSGPGTGAFTVKLFADYCAFSMDRTLLRDLAYHANLQMSRFLSKMLEVQADGKLLVEHSASPEQRHRGKYYQTKGCAFDQQMVYECYKDTVEMADALGIREDFIEQLRESLPLLDPVQIGASGQIKEFREEEAYGDIGEWNHRHISHLVGLYPGTLINRNRPEWLRAAERSLDLRGDFSTGWSVAHKLNAWARTGNGARAYDLLQVILSQCTLPNLWDTHPPFQIDGNFGATAGMAEMLLQSHGGYLHLLPSLPDAWESGSFCGLTARGGFTVSASWQHHHLSAVRVRASVDGELRMLVGEACTDAEVADGLLTCFLHAGEERTFSFRAP